MFFSGVSLQYCYSPALPPNLPVNGYSYGIMAYEMVTGVCPFSGNSFTDISKQHLEERLPLFYDAIAPRIDHLPP